MRYLPFLLLFAFALYAFVDCVQTRAAHVRRLPKGAWLLLTWFPLLGGLGWFVYGRPARGEARRAVEPPVAPDDDPDFLRTLRGRGELPEDSEERLLAEWEDDLRRDDDHTDEDGRDRP